MTVYPFEALDRRVWLRLSRWRFDRLPTEKRVRLEIGTDGRQLSFLLSAIHGAGYGVQLARGPMLFRELLALRRRVPLAARVDSHDGLCGLTLSDDPLAPGSPVRISYDVFTPGRDGTRMPYGMHPSIYYRGAHCRPWDPDRNAQAVRPIRIGFYGTHDPEFYSRDYAFPGLNRSELLEAFIASYGNECIPAPTDQRVAFAVSIDRRGGELQPKRFLPQHAYLQTLRRTAFALCLPGWCMPLSHSLIEAIYCGAIPITNAHTFMHPPLRHGIEALTFTTISEFHAAIQEALAMPEPSLQSMRQAMASYYMDYLDSSSWWSQFLNSRASELLVNAEELSVPLMVLPS